MKFNEDVVGDVHKMHKMCSGDGGGDDGTGRWGRVSDVTLTGMHNMLAGDCKGKRGKMLVHGARVAVASL